MINIYGTSHVSHESIKRIDQALEEHDPDIIALELDPIRLEALRTGERSEGGPIFLRLLRKFQEKIGSKTGLMPGQEMLYAYRKAIENDIDVVLIDQDIRITVEKLKGLRRKEKVKAFFALLFGLFWPGDFDVSEIPDEEVIEEISNEMKESFPGLYRILMEERNLVMADALREVQQDNPDSNIVAFVGAAHKRYIEEELNELDSQSTVEQFF